MCKIEAIKTKYYNASVVPEFYMQDGKIRNNCGSTYGELFAQGREVVELAVTKHVGEIITISVPCSDIPYLVKSAVTKGHISLGSKVTSTTKAGITEYKFENHYVISIQHDKVSSSIPKY